MNKTIIFSILLVLVSSIVIADQKAVTSNGKEVILYDNGTWKYSNKKSYDEIKIKTNSKKFEKNKNASFLLKSKKNNSAFYIDTNKWTVEKDTDDKEYSFKLKKEDAYGMVITEQIEISIEVLARAGFSNAQAVAPDIEIVQKEYRTVNGKKVIFMEMKGTISGINFTYLGYYFSNSSGSTQLITYTGTNLIKKYRSEMMDFLNGLTTQGK